MNIFVINLDRDVDRWKILEKNFSNNLSEFTRISAFDKDNLSAQEYFNILKSDLVYAKRLMTPGEISCALSHKKAINAFIESDTEYGLIFEDDVIGGQNELKKVIKITDFATDDAVLVLGCQDGLSSKRKLFGKQISSNVYDIPRTSIQYLHRATAYLLNKDSAQKIVNLYDSGLFLADDWVFICKKTGLKPLFSPLFAHPVDLTDSRLDNDRFFAQKLMMPKNIIYRLFNYLRRYLKDILSLIIKRFFFYKSIYSS